MIVVSLALAASATGAPSSTAPSETTTGKSYAYKLTVGMAGQMWTPAQVRAKHPKTGEVMLSGSMGGAMSIGGSSRHVEVLITRRSSGKVVAGAQPTIALLDTNAINAMAVKLPVATMRGVDEGSAAIHCGNNVDLVPGHLYKVTVRLADQQAVFRITAPKG
jgi:hypothetical protein